MPVGCRRARVNYICTYVVHTYIRGNAVTLAAAGWLFCWIRFAVVCLPLQIIVVFHHVCHLNKLLFIHKLVTVVLVITTVLN